MELLTEHHKPKRLLLAGIEKARADVIERNLGYDAEVWVVGEHDTLTPELVDVVDVIMVDAEKAEFLIPRFANIAGDDDLHVMVLVLGNQRIPDDLRQIVPTLRRVDDPIDYSYLRGLLDSAHLGRLRMRRLDEEQSRVRSLYEISSALLKVTNRAHIAPALENTLPQLLDTSMILLVFPSDPQPIFFMHCPDGFTSDLVEAVKSHLKEAWDVLRSDFDVNWEWLSSLAPGTDSYYPMEVNPGSFITTPISSGTRTEGFLTVLPRSEKHFNEAFLQTFFVIGDLISVLLHNLELRERLEERAMHDGLTRLYNRQTLIEHLERECRRSQRHANPVCIVMMDIDFFKSINDKFGHQAGDEVLRVVARRLRNSVRDEDIVGRCGGEEFITVLVNTNLEGGKIWAERFRQQLAEDCITFLDKKITITASLGVATAEGSDANVDGLIGRADAALYEAKRLGRNRVVLSSEVPEVAAE